MIYSISFIIFCFLQVYEGTFQGKLVALKIFLDARSMKENSCEGLTAASADIVDKMEKVRQLFWTEQSSSSSIIFSKNTLVDAGSQRDGRSSTPEHCQVHGLLQSSPMHHDRSLFKR